MGLLLLIILAIIFYTLFDIFASRASGKMDANLSSVIFNSIRIFEIQEDWSFTNNNIWYYQFTSRRSFNCNFFNITY